MLSQLPDVEPDPLWALMRECKEDPRTEKIDLVVGVYRDVTGKTPVMRAVQDAEVRLAADSPSKAYKDLSGNAGFIDGISRFILGPENPDLSRQCTIQTVGGTGALRMLADFIARISPDATVWITDPGYINHRPIMTAVGLTVKTFRWQENAVGLDMDAVLEDLKDAREGDVLLLHGCCHNPTGIDPSLEQWASFASLCRDKRLLPLIDMAYQGFGDGVDEDAAGLRLMVRELDTLLISASCSKNMGLYCERTGAAMVVAPDATPLSHIRFTLERIARANYSMPPDHGAAVATILFESPQTWLPELEESRRRVADIRQGLGNRLCEIGAPAKFQALERQKGMFSLLPLSPSQMKLLRDEFAIYGTSSGRINIAGLSFPQINRLADALQQIS